MNPEIIDEITGKLPSIRSASRVQVMFRNADTIEISVQKWVDLSLKEGMSVTRELFSMLQKAQAETEALEKAFRFLQTRPRTEHEVDMHLEKKDYPALVRRHVKQKLYDMGLLNDTEFAHLFVEQKKSQMSQMELSWKLRKRGIDSNVADAVVRESYDQGLETETALRLGQKQWKKHQEKAVSERRAKVGQYLQRKGFHTSVIYAALDNLERFPEDNGTCS